MDRQNLLCFHYHRWFVSSHVRIACITYDHVKIESSDSKCGQQYHSLSFQISRVSTKMLLPSPPKNWAPNGENRSESDGGKLALAAQVKNFQIGLNVQNAVLYSGAARQFFFFEACCRKRGNKNHGQHWFVGIFCSRCLNLTHVWTKKHHLVLFSWSSYFQVEWSSTSQPFFFCQIPTATWIFKSGRWVGCNGGCFGLDESGVMDEELSLNHQNFSFS